MEDRIALNGVIEAAFLTESEKIAIEQKVDFEMNAAQFKMIKLGGIANCISGIFLIWILAGQIKSSVLFGWYIALVGINLANIGFSLLYKFKKVSPEHSRSWIKFYHLILLVLSLTWGSIGVLFASADLTSQLFIAAFLLAVLVGFSFGTITDFVASAISIICLLVPYIAFQAFLGLRNPAVTLHSINLSLGFSICMFILGAFMLITCFIGNRLIRKSFRSTFINQNLTNKLDNLNKHLEQRVKERTVELEQTLKIVKYQATHDLLTDLPNHRLLVQFMETAIKTAQENNTLFGVIFFSLNEIEKITDGLGHQISALVIQTIAERLQKTFGNLDKDNADSTKYHITLSRRDEFVILVSPIHSIENIEQYAESLFSVLTKPIKTEAQPLKLTASIGVSVYPRDGREVRSLLMNADAAMIRAKQWGGNKLNIYQAEINANISRLLELENQLHNALENNEFILHYQPLVELKTGQITGLEALIRWRNPRLGFIPPMDFIGLAEKDGLIVPLGEWVLKTACAQVKAWHLQGFTDLKVSVNLSVKQLYDASLVKFIVNLLKECDLEPKYLELELTETDAFKEGVMPIVRQFKSMGINLAIDDFGTGYSGLMNLKVFAIDKLKIDKSFVQDIDTNEDSRAIVANTINLAKKIKVTVLAEGVETKEQLQFLYAHGCDMIQGYYFSPPVPAEVFTELLQSKRNLPIAELNTRMKE